MEGIWRHETETTLHDGAGEGAAGSAPRLVAPLGHTLCPCQPSSPQCRALDPSLPSSKLSQPPWTPETTGLTDQPAPPSSASQVLPRPSRAP